MTKNYKERMVQHRKNPNDWVRTHQLTESRKLRTLLKKIHKESDIPAIEQLETLKAMCKYGIENVRGASFTTFTLRPEQITSIKHDLIPHYLDHCVSCLKPGHKAKRCNNRHIPRPLFISCAEHNSEVARQYTRRHELAFENKENIKCSKDANKKVRNAHVEHSKIENKMVLRSGKELPRPLH